MEENSITDVKETLAGIQEVLASLKEGQNEINRRMNSFEDCGSIDEGEDNVKEDENNDKIKSIEDGFQKSDEEEEFEFQPAIQMTAKGPSIGKNLAKGLSNSLLIKSDEKTIKEIQDKYPPPDNLSELQVPSMNSEISFKKHNAIASREQAMFIAQKSLTSG